MPLKVFASFLAVCLIMDKLEANVLFLNYIEFLERGRGNLSEDLP